MSNGNDITYFAETSFRNERRRFGIKRADRRRHVYVIGKTGTGKTTMLDNMTVQDIQRGNGVAVIDPHGTYAERMLSFIPPERVKDVVYFNPADTEYPLGFNMLEKPSENMRHFVASGLMSVFKKLWVDAWSARMEYFLSNSILTHLEMDNATLMGVQRIFGDKDYRRAIVPLIKDPIVRGFWENEFAKLPEQFMREAVAAIQNKVGQFISNPLVRNIIAQPQSTFNIRSMMDERKILIANLSKGRIGEENSNLLGAMLVTKIYLAALSRADTAEDDLEDFYVYVDEFQNFATEAFAGILSEARKYRLNLTLANQYMAQLVDDKTKSSLLRDAVIGNVGTMISFRIGAEDAEQMEKEFFPEFVVQDFVNLGFAQTYLKLMIDGVSSRPFSAKTLPPIQMPVPNHIEESIQYSRERYGRPVAVVAAEIEKWSRTLPNTFEYSSASSEPRGAGTFPTPDSLRTSNASPIAVSQAPMDSRPAITPSGAVSSARTPARLAASKPEKEKKMYPAKCAVDGADILVPFQPDGRRPVYCQEHLSQIQRSGGSPANETRPSGGNQRVPDSSRQDRRPRRESGSRENHQIQSAPIVRAIADIKPVSLSSLLPKEEAYDMERNQRIQLAPENPKEQKLNSEPLPKKKVDLDELRRVLQQSMARNDGAVSRDPQPAAPAEIAKLANERPNPVPVSPMSASSSGTIEPGQEIKFD